MLERHLACGWGEYRGVTVLARGSHIPGTSIAVLCSVFLFNGTKALFAEQIQAFFSGAKWPHKACWLQ